MYGSYKTLIKMLGDRGIKVGQILDEKQFASLEDDNEISVKINRDLSLVWCFRSSFYSKIPKFIKQLDTGMKIIFIIDGETSQVPALLAHMKIKYDFEVFYPNEILKNRMEDDIVDKTVLCTKEEQSNIEKTYVGEKPAWSLSGLGNFPLRYLGAKKGDMVKTMRESDTMSGFKIPYWRVVID
jgi:DNA-directed RNA polymerase subunit H (RpoH/RPB5)